MPDAVLLPDGKVLVVNGSSAGRADDAKDPVYAADLFDPEAESWVPLAEMKTPRLYHATALLLPDARVLSAGSDRVWNPHPPYDVAQTQSEVFSPPYLFRGPRPEIRMVKQDADSGMASDIRRPISGGRAAQASLAAAKARAAVDSTAPMLASTSVLV
jgi:hypothetical protein